MSKVRREITRKLRILQHAEETGDVSKTCRYCGGEESLQQKDLSPPSCAVRRKNRPRPEPRGICR